MQAKSMLSDAIVTVVELKAKYLLALLPVCLTCYIFSHSHNHSFTFSAYFLTYVKI